MDTTLELQRQIDEQRFAETDPVRLTMREMLLMLHTGLPGIVQSFNAATQTAVVQPAIKCLIVDEDSIELPPCPDVPVYFPGGGNLVLTFPVAQGDNCLLVFSERAIDFWFDRGGTQEPSEVRMHDLSDGFAFVGFRPKPNAISGVSTTGAELRTLDGSVVLRVDSGGVTAGAVAGAAPVMLLTPDVITWLAAVGTGSSAGPAPTDIGATLLKGK